MSLSLSSPEILPALLRLAGTLSDRDFLVREDGWRAEMTRRVSDQASAERDIIALIVGLDEVNDSEAIEEAARAAGNERAERGLAELTEWVRTKAWNR
jgi:hypothetical protein